MKEKGYRIRFTVDASRASWVSSQCQLPVRGWLVQALRAIVLRRNWGKVPVLHSAELAISVLPRSR